LNWGVRMEMLLGRFGDRRLEKGGRVFWSVLLRKVAEGSGSGVLARAARARSG
jgi:hypothetical protein